jgi:hypothetical protein
MIEREAIGDPAAAVVPASAKCTWPSCSIASIIALAIARLVYGVWSLSLSGMSDQP